jgi:hypothetical protein
VYQKVQFDSERRRYAGEMSQRNGDRARFQKDRRRKLRHRQRIQALIAALRAKAAGNSSAITARSPSLTRPPLS